jgi:hypothetical protein
VVPRGQDVMISVYNIHRSPAGEQGRLACHQKQTTYKHAARRLNSVRNSPGACSSSPPHSPTCHVACRLLSACSVGQP